jgi:hypothetical protein
MPRWREIESEDKLKNSIGMSVSVWPLRSRPNFKKLSLSYRRVRGSKLSIVIGIVVRFLVGRHYE